MAWTESAIFRAWMTAALAPDAAFEGKWDPGEFDNVAGDGYMVALYNTGTTPDKSVAAAQSAYPVGQWVVGNEVTDSTVGAIGAGWPAGGVPLAGPTYTDDGPMIANPNPPPAIQVAPIVFAGDDTVNGPAGTVTLVDVSGDLLYWTGTGVAANQGAAFHWFGGPNQVSAGTFTIIWNAQGIMVQLV
jgi:hypothetical protein